MAGGRSVKPKGDAHLAFARARDNADSVGMAAAALQLADDHLFGAHQGRTPALLFEAYSSASGELKTRLAIALARVWGYANEPERAAPFAAEAVRGAAANPELLTDALDAQLLAHWGPDDLVERLAITSQLEDAVAHSLDVEARLRSYLWRLTTALETLDAVSVQRQLRALDRLADEAGTARTRFFSESRRGMYALLVGDSAEAAVRVTAASRAGEAAGEVDTEAIVRELSAGIARQRDDRAALAVEAAAFEDYGSREGIASVTAEAAVLWAAAGSPDAARRLLYQLAGGLDRLHRDVDWLFTVTSLASVAADLGERELAASAVTLLEPYAGRGVVNAGAVSFSGVVDDYLYRVGAASGQEQGLARWAAGRVDGYRRLGATWWMSRLSEGPEPLRPRDKTVPTVEAVLAPQPSGLWLVGHDGRIIVATGVRGFAYLRLLLERPGIDVAAVDLVGAVAGHSELIFTEAGLGPILDRPALTAYRARLNELTGELAQAEEWADTGRASVLSAEREALLAQVGSALGLQGRRRPTGSTAEKARVAVRKAMVTGLARIELADPWLGRLLRDTIRTGATCSYQPDPTRPVTWRLADHDEHLSD